eukprot:scaffold1554_cov332-Pavlova_lutheri.AAC.10
MASRMGGSRGSTSFPSFSNPVDPIGSGFKGRSIDVGKHSSTVRTWRRTRGANETSSIRCDVLRTPSPNRWTWRTRNRWPCWTRYGRGPRSSNGCVALGTDAAPKETGTVTNLVAPSERQCSSRPTRNTKDTPKRNLEAPISLRHRHSRIQPRKERPAKGTPIQIHNYKDSHHRPRERKHAGGSPRPLDGRQGSNEAGDGSSATTTPPEDPGPEDPDDETRAGGAPRNSPTKPRTCENETSPDGASLSSCVDRDPGRPKDPEGICKAPSCCEASMPAAGIEDPVSPSSKRCMHEFADPARTHPKCPRRTIPVPIFPTTTHHT